MLDDLTQELDFGIDWELANEDAERWAQQYGYALVNRLNNTTRRRLAAEIAEWTQNSETINQLAARLSGLFDARRARTIAVTEVTRAYAQGNQAAWARSKVIDAKRWNTANDELVCPICGPLNGRIVPLSGTFDGIDNPPAHPNCRCWITPVVMEVEDPIAAEIEFLQNAGNIDLLAVVRPPGGRAPRGRGQEYATRRRIASRIRTQMKWRDKIDANLAVYRGQANQAGRITEMRWRRAELQKGIEAMLDIATQPAGDWDFKAELVDSIIEYVQALVGANA